MAKELFSFGDLKKHMKANAPIEAMRNAKESAKKGDFVGAVAALGSYDLSNLPPNDRALCGQWHYQAGKVFLERDLGPALVHFRRAVSYGFSPWYVNARIQMAVDRNSGTIRAEPLQSVIAGIQASWSEPGPSPSLLEIARHTGRLAPPITPPDFQDVRQNYCLGVYRWQGDRESSSPLSRLIRRMKHAECPLATEALAYLLSLGVREVGMARQPDLIMPVPPDPARARERGFDNVAELAQHLGRFLLIPTNVDTIVKVRPTPDLRHVNRANRRSTLRGVFGIRGDHKRLEGLTVMLVDDVVTSGATLDACAIELLNQGVARVVAAAVAHSESSND